MKRRPPDSRLLARVGRLLLRGVLPRVLGLAALGAVVVSVVAAGQVLPVADPAPPAPLGQVALDQVASDQVASGQVAPGQVAPGQDPPAAGAAGDRTGTVDDGTPGATPSAGPAAGPTAGSGSGPTVGGPGPVVDASGRQQLPRGGTTVFPRYRLVGFSGGPGSAAFGRLGVGDLDDRAREIEGIAAGYAAGREPLPVFELVAVVALPRPGPDGLYRTRVERTVIQQYLDAARRHRALLLLNVQPGRADFLDEVKALEPWLREPDVGLALDPEWAVGPGQVPGRVFGRTTGTELDRVSRWVSALVEANRLPEKVVVVHQLSPQVLRDEGALREHPGVAMVKSVDGIGSPEAKVATWRKLVDGRSPVLHPGFKLFYEEDTKAGPLMSREQVLGLTPQPEYVLYE